MANRPVASGTVVLFAACLGLVSDTEAQSVPSYDRFDRIVSYDHPAWSPEGKEILFNGGPPREHRSFRVPASGGEPVAIWDELHRGHVAVSRSGRLAFNARNPDGSWHIWTANRDGSSAAPLTGNMPGSQNSPAWSPDGSKIAFECQNGPIGTIYVTSVDGDEPRKILEGSGPTWSKDGTSLAYLTGLSFLTSSQAVAIKPLDGQPRRLTSTVIKTLGPNPTTFDWSPDNRQILISRIENGRWRIDVIDVDADKVVSQLPLKGSAKSPKWSPDGKRIAYIQEDTGHPAGVHIVAADGTEDMALTRVEEFVTARFLTYKSADGTEIPSFLYEPPGAKANHPAIVWVHGGIGGAILDEFDPAIQYFVSNGFVVIAPNFRSSSGFDQALQKVKSGDEIVDDLAGSVDYLKSLNSVDPAHIFTVGFSLGGWAVLRAITAKPGLFSAAVEFAGVADVRLQYETNPLMRAPLTALLGGSPEQAPDRYRHESPVFAVDRLAAPLLILHGDNDHTNSFRQAEELDAALKKAGKAYELIRYPGEDHGFQRSAWRDAMQQIMRFLNAQMAAEPVKPERKTRTTVYRAALNN